MASTLTSILVHLIFSTKHRDRIITPAIEPDLYAYIGGICRANNSALLDAGGDADHVHLLIDLGKTIALSDLLQEIKRASSKWIKTRGGEFATFHWQDGYAAFSIEQSQVKTLHTYFANQKEHHKKLPFKDELIEFLRRYNVPFDERYLG